MISLLKLFSKEKMKNTKPIVGVLVMLICMLTTASAVSCTVTDTLTDEAYYISPINDNYTIVGDNASYKCFSYFVSSQGDKNKEYINSSTINNSAFSKTRSLETWEYKHNVVCVGNGTGYNCSSSTVDITVGGYSGTAGKGFSQIEILMRGIGSIFSIQMVAFMVAIVVIMLVLSISGALVVFISQLFGAIEKKI